MAGNANETAAADTSDERTALARSMRGRNDETLGRLRAHLAAENDREVFDLTTDPWRATAEALESYHDRKAHLARLLSISRKHTRMFLIAIPFLAAGFLYYWLSDTGTPLSNYETVYGITPIILLTLIMGGLSLLDPPWRAKRKYDACTLPGEMERVASGWAETGSVRTDCVVVGRQGLAFFDHVTAVYVRLSHLLTIKPDRDRNTLTVRFETARADGEQGDVVSVFMKYPNTTVPSSPGELISPEDDAANSLSNAIKNRINYALWPND